MACERACIIQLHGRIRMFLFRGLCVNSFPLNKSLYYDFVIFCFWKTGGRLSACFYFVCEKWYSRAPYNFALSAFILFRQSKSMRVFFKSKVFKHAHWYQYCTWALQDENRAPRLLECRWCKPLRTKSIRRWQVWSLGLPLILFLCCFSGQRSSDNIFGPLGYSDIMGSGSPREVSLRVRYAVRLMFELHLYRFPLLFEVPKSERSNVE